MLVELLDAVELAALLAFNEKEMKLAIIVGGGSLLGMAKTGNHSHHPHYPGMSAEKLTGGIDTEADGEVDSHKPEVAAEAVEDASETRILLGHTCQLAVGAVEGVSPDEQKHAYNI